MTPRVTGGVVRNHSSSRGGGGEEGGGEGGEVELGEGGGEGEGRGEVDMINKWLRTESAVDSTHNFLNIIFVAI
jgi:hypothetical protein